MLPKVSIVIPVFNGSNYLKSAIDSALGQSYPNIEVVVVNDGSNDNGETEAIALSYGSRIRYFSKSNGGVATALNKGIAEMTGDYFSWLSHDDYYQSDKVENELQALASIGDPFRIVLSDYDLLDVDSGITTHVHLGSVYDSWQLEESVFSVLRGVVHGCAMLVHRSHFNRVGVFKENLLTTQDYDLWFRMFRHEKLLYLDKVAVVSRVHSQQGSRTMDCHKNERDLLHTEFVNSLTSGEMIKMYGSEYQFYYKMSEFFKANKMANSFSIMNKKFMSHEMPANTIEKVNVFHGYLNQLSNGRAKQICIFCAGEWGLKLWHELKGKLVKVEYFADNDTRKYGYVTDGAFCKPVQELEKEKEYTLVIVATRNPDPILKQLGNLGFPFVVTKQMISKELDCVPPVKWLYALDSVRNIDFSSEEFRTLINCFNDTIFDICTYFQSKVYKS